MTLPRHLDRVSSNVAGIAWPPIAAPARAPLLLAVERLERSQWLPPAMIARAQQAQLARVVWHHAAHSKMFAARLRDVGLKPADLATPAGFAALPPITRTDLQIDRAALDSGALPDGHAPTFESRTSGSTGEPITVRKTAIDALLWRAQTMRWHFWSGEARRNRFGFVRVGVKTPGARQSWGAPFSLMGRTGPAWAIDIRTDFNEVGRQLAAFDPHHLLTHPSVLTAMLDRIDSGEIALPSLKTARLLAEPVTDALKARAAGRVRLSSCYSSAEMGYLALQCPVSGLYHNVAETCLVEILRDDGTAAAEGERGRVVATTLHNHATPLIRYANGDWAEVGPRCPCGRGLPTLSRILGRTYGMMTMPDGRKRWPMVGTNIAWTSVAPLKQVQVIQHARDRLEIRYRAEEPLSAPQATRLAAMIRAYTDPGFGIAFTRVEGRLDNPRSGKFEEFISKLD